MFAENVGEGIGVSQWYVIQVYMSTRTHAAYSA